MSANNWMAQDLADILDLEVERPDFIETTALGAAILAAVGCSLYPDLASAASAMRGGASSFAADMTSEVREARLARYARALAAA